MSAATNRPFSDFPTDFNLLPRVAFVIPNLNNDMHDGTIEQADAWLTEHIKPYAEWAMKNNSLLIITWDEDEFEQRNRIPTILYGPMVRAGTHDATATLQDLLRTLSDIFAIEPPGNAANVSGIVGVFDSDPKLTTKRFQRGTGNSDVVDTYIDSTVTFVPRGTISPLAVNGETKESQGLVRFNSIIGNAPHQIPPGVSIASAKLLLLTGPVTGDNSTFDASAHSLLRTWNDRDTWDTLGGGISIDGIEAAVNPEMSLLPNVDDAWAIFDVTRSVQQFAWNPSDNRGWLLRMTGGEDRWRFASSDAASVSDRPMLEVTYIVPQCEGDLTSDGIVDDSDFVQFLASYNGRIVPPANFFADINVDGIVDMNDFARFAEAYDDYFCPA